MNGSRWRRSLVVLAGVLAGFGLALTSPTVAGGGNRGGEPPSRIERERSKRLENANAGDPNIKSRRGPVRRNAAVQAPMAKRSRSEQRRSTSRQIRYGTVVADNWTDWPIDIYIDGQYRGTVPDWGELTRDVVAGTTTIYGRCEFDDGTVYTWGPRVFELSPGGFYTWRLDP